MALIFYNPLSLICDFKTLINVVAALPFGFFVSLIDLYEATFAGASSGDLSLSILCDIFVDHSTCSI